jgi:hypothetical protein
VKIALQQQCTFSRITKSLRLVAGRSAWMLEQVTWIGSASARCRGYERSFNCSLDSSNVFVRAKAAGQ